MLVSSVLWWVCATVVNQKNVHQHQAMAPRVSRDSSSDNSKSSFHLLVFLTLLFSYHCHHPSRCPFPFRSLSATAAPFMSLCRSLKPPDKQGPSCPAPAGTGGAGCCPSQQSCLWHTRASKLHLLHHPGSHVGKENEMCLQLITLRSREQHWM